MKLVKVVSLALLLSGLLAGFVLLNRNQNLQKSAYSGDNRLLFFPESVTKSVGDTFLVYVKISPPLPGAGEAAKKVTAVEFKMQYDSSKLEVLPQSASAVGYALRPGTNLIGGVTSTNTLFFDPDTTSVVKNTSAPGTIDFTGVSTASGGVENPGEVYVVGYYFRIKSGANTSADISLSNGNVGYVGSSVAESISVSASGKTTVNIKGVDPVGTVIPEPTTPPVTSIPPTSPPGNCTKPSGSCSGSEMGDDNYCLNKTVSSCFGSPYTVPACSTLQFGCSDATDPGSKITLCREQCPAGWTSVMKTISTKGDLNCKVWKCVPPSGSEPTTPPSSPVPTTPSSAMCKVCNSEQPPRSAGNAYSVSLNACDNLVNNTDYTMWAGEYFQTNGSAGAARNQQSDHWQGDFNCDGKVTLADYQLWANTIVHQ